MEMSALIGRFLDVAAIESGRIKAEPETFPLAPVADHVADRHTARAVAKEIALVRVYPDAPTLVHADKKFTKEILDNLISNALKFSPHGRTVTLRVEPSPEGVVLSVEDQGPGLTEEDRRRLFGRFARLSARPTGGETSTGLGLSIVKHMVEAMGGRIWVDSEPGRGAAFRVALPGGED
jgi:signal transduction histidine kinase